MTTKFLTMYVVIGYKVLVFTILQSCFQLDLCSRKVVLFVVTVDFRRDSKDLITDEKVFF